MNNNIELEIIKLNGQKFKFGNGYYIPEGYCLKCEFGYIAFKNSQNPNIPYIPRGNRKALQSIVDEGGFSSYEEILFLDAMD